MDLKKKGGKVKDQALGPTVPGERDTVRPQHSCNLGKVDLGPCRRCIESCACDNDRTVFFSVRKHDLSVLGGGIGGVDFRGKKS